MDWKPLAPTFGNGSLSDEDVVIEEVSHTSLGRFDKAKVTDLYVDVVLKTVLSGFIVVFICMWFNFMKDTVYFYIYHYHITDNHIPESVIIATITLGTTVTGLMVIILKGLFKSKE